MNLTFSLIMMFILLAGFIYILFYVAHVLNENKKLLHEMEKIVSGKKEAEKPSIPPKIFLRLFLNSFIPTKGDTILFLLAMGLAIPLILKAPETGLLLWAGIMITMIYARFSSSVKVTSAASTGNIFMGNAIRTEYDVVIHNRKKVISTEKLFQGGIITYFLITVIIMVIYPFL